MQLTARLVAALASIAIVLATGHAHAQPEEPAAPPQQPTTPAPPEQPAEPAQPVEPTPPSTEPAQPAQPATTKPENNLVAKGSLSVAGYLDTVATTVLTPSIGGSVENPIAGWGINGRYLLDVVSAASPDIVSTASPPFKELRQGGTLGGRYKPGNFGVGGSFNASYSPDYLALSGSLQLTEDLNDKNLTLFQSYSYGHDTIGRARVPFSTFSRSLDTHAVTLGLSSVVNSALVLGFSADAIFEDGDQSKPYRYIPMFSRADAARIQPGASVDTIADLRIQARPLEQLPLSRQRFAGTGRLAWRFDRSTLRVEQRGYADSWGLGAATTDARYFIDTSERVSIWPHVRFHVQNAVSFWQRVYGIDGYRALPALRTSDRELGPLWTAGFGGGLRLALGRAGRVDDIVWTTTLDGFYTSFSDTIYVTERLSGLLTTGLEVTF